MQSAAEAKIACVKKLFAKVFRIKLTLEQWGTELDFLECHLGDITGPGPITRRRIQWDMPEGSSTPSTPRKLMDPDAPNTRNMLRAFIPNEVKKCTYYRVTATGATSNLNVVIRLMKHKQYTCDWWRPKLRQCATRRSLSLPGGPSAPLGDHASGTRRGCAASSKHKKRQPEQREEGGHKIFLCLNTWVAHPPCIHLDVFLFCMSAFAF